MSIESEIEEYNREDETGLREIKNIEKSIKTIRKELKEAETKLDSIENLLYYMDFGCIIRAERVLRDFINNLSHCNNYHIALIINPEHPDNKTDYARTLEILRDQVMQKIQQLIMAGESYLEFEDRSNKYVKSEIIDCEKFFNQMKSKNKE